MASIETAGGSGKTRHLLAIAIVALSLIGIAITSGLAIGQAGDTDRAETTRLVFTSMLPLLGTWVGTVLAFYFARENLRDTTESSLRLSGQLQADTPVQRVMIPRAAIATVPLGPGGDPDSLRLFALYNEMQSRDLHRMPIFLPSGALRYVIHDSVIAEFAARANKDPRDDVEFTETIDDLRRYDDLMHMIEAVGFVGPTDSLAVARATMRSVESCNDIFVTTNGQSSDSVIGWLTNTDLAGYK